MIQAVPKLDPIISEMVYGMSVWSSFLFRYRPMTLVQTIVQTSRDLKSRLVTCLHPMSHIGKSLIAGGNNWYKCVEEHKFDFKLISSLSSFACYILSLYWTDTKKKKEARIFRS